MHTCRIYLGALIVVCLTLFATVASANWAEEVWNRDKLTGDWGGLRSDLSKKGIDLDFRLSQYWQRVASGGNNVNSEYGGTMDYRLNIDTHKLFGTWEGLSVNMHARTRFGYDVNADAGAFALQNAGMLTPAPDDYHNTDITGLTVSQYLPFFGGLANISIGQFDVIDTVTGLIPQASYGQEGFWNVNALTTALPWFGAVKGLSLYGAMAVTVNQKYKMAQSGFLVMGTENESTKMNSVSDAFEDGAWLAGFHRLFWELDGKMGWFMLFAGYSTEDQLSNDPHDFFLKPGVGIQNDDTEKNPWDVAFEFYQTFWQAEGNPDRKATFFIGATMGPDNPQFAQWNAFTAIEGFGLIPSRPHDRMGLSGWYSGLSNDFVKLTSKVDIRLRDTWGLEVYYNYQINKWLHLSPDFQLIKNEQTRDDIAIIPGVRMVIDF